MEKILSNIEHTNLIYNKELKAHPNSDSFISDAICYNAARMSSELGARAIIGMTFSGYTAFMLSSYRPKSDIFIFTENRDLLNTLSICWGVRAFFYDKFVGTDTSIRDVIRILKDNAVLRSGELAVNIGSMPLANQWQSQYGKSYFGRLIRILNSPQNYIHENFVTLPCIFFLLILCFSTNLCARHHRF
jgi:pyruvate kinase